MKNGDPVRANKEMDGWKVLVKSLPDGEPLTVEMFAELMGVSVDLVYRWQRRPLTSEEPDSTGRRNPIDYFGRLVCALYAVNPEGAELVFEWADHLRAELRARHGAANSIPLEKVEEKLRTISRETGLLADQFATEKK
jgi:hypothetical protein